MQKLYLAIQTILYHVVIMKGLKEKKRALEIVKHLTAHFKVILNLSSLNVYPCITELGLLFETPEEELPSNDQQVSEHFFLL